MRGVIGLSALLLILGALAYLDVSGQTDSWPEVPCKIIGSRAVPQMVHTPPTFVLWKGQYQLQYQVNGQQYSVWADAVDWNEDRIFVESSMSHRRQNDCNVRFNPTNPSEAVPRINPN